jgi:methylphosphotriester-DNA--protein-cysteine methyltransferase
MRTLHLIPDRIRGCDNPMQVVTRALRYFSLHGSDPLPLPDLAEALDISEDCLEYSFDQVRGMTTAQALQVHRLNRLFTVLSAEPRQTLEQAIRRCGLAQTRGVVPLFEQTFGIEMALFLLTCRRAAEDRLFRREHQDSHALVLSTSACPTAKS